MIESFVTVSPGLVKTSVRRWKWYLFTNSISEFDAPNGIVYNTSRIIDTTSLMVLFTKCNQPITNQTNHPDLLLCFKLGVAKVAHLCLGGVGAIV